jgi:hypothetical protein
MVAAGVGRAVCIKGLRISVLIELPYSPEKKLGTYCTETAEDIDKLVRLTIILRVLFDISKIHSKPRSIATHFIIDINTVKAQVLQKLDRAIRELLAPCISSKGSPKVR